MRRIWKPPPIKVTVLERKMPPKIIGVRCPVCCVENDVEDAVCGKVTCANCGSKLQWEEILK